MQGTLEDLLNLVQNKKSNRHVRSFHSIDRVAACRIPVSIYLVTSAVVHGCHVCRLKIRVDAVASLQCGDQLKALPNCLPQVDAPVSGKISRACLVSVLELMVSETSYSYGALFGSSTADSEPGSSPIDVIDVNIIAAIFSFGAHSSTTYVQSGIAISLLAELQFVCSACRCCLF